MPRMATCHWSSIWSGLESFLRGLRAVGPILPNQLVKCLFQFLLSYLLNWKKYKQPLWQWVKLRFIDHSLCYSSVHLALAWEVRARLCIAFCTFGCHLVTFSPSASLTLFSELLINHGFHTCLSGLCSGFMGSCAFSEFELPSHCNVNQSRPEEITMQEVVQEGSYIGDDGFGKGWFVRRNIRDNNNFHPNLQFK